MHVQHIIQQRQPSVTRDLLQVQLRVLLSINSSSMKKHLLTVKETTEVEVIPGFMANTIYANRERTCMTKRHGTSLYVENVFFIFLT